MPRRAWALPHRARMVRGDLQQRRGAPQLFLPVAELRFQALAAEPVALPHGEVRVLHRQLRQRRGLAPAEGAVEGGRFPHQHAPAPSVADDVVHRQQQHVVVVGQAQQRAPQKRPARQVERTPGLVGGEALRPVHRVRSATQVYERQRHRRVRTDELHRNAAALAEDRAQRLVPPHHLAEARPQGGDVQHTAQAQGVGHVVRGAARIQPVHHPQPLLRERQRRRVAGGPAGYPLLDRAASLPHDLLQERLPPRGRELPGAGGGLIAHVRQWQC